MPIVMMFMIKTRMADATIFKQLWEYIHNMYVCGTLFNMLLVLIQFESIVLFPRRSSLLLHLKKKIRTRDDRVKTSPEEEKPIEYHRLHHVILTEWAHKAPRAHTLLFEESFNELVFALTFSLPFCWAEIMRKVFPIAHYYYYLKCVPLLL